MKQPLYYSPRALLIHYLNNDPRPDLVKWIRRGKSFRLKSISGLKQIWNKWARRRKRHRLEYYNQLRCDFYSSLFAGTEKVPEYVSSFNSLSPAVLYGPKYKIFTLSTQKRTIVNDLIPGNLHEFIIRLLSELTRTDWLDWEDIKQYRFKIKRIDMMGDAYVKLNNIKTNNPLYYMKLMLSSLCITGILIKIPDDKYCYEFNREWYDNEVRRTVDGEDDPNNYKRMSEQMVLSWIHYPDQTIDGMLPCCKYRHNNNAFVYM